MLLLQGCALPTCKFHMMEGQKRVENFPGRAILALSKLKDKSYYSIHISRTCNKKTKIHLRS